jgi:hypothetical protein
LNSRPIKVLFILGWGRSGTTILDNVLGEVDGFFSAGELRYIWQRGFMGSGTCGCGRPVTQCEIWSAVQKTAFGGTGLRPSEVVRRQSEVVRVRHTWRLLRQRRGSPRRHAGLQSYIDAAARLYSAVAEVTGARVIVDSSKRPSDGALLRLIPEVTEYYVHMVRDPRAVAYSWQRRKPLTNHDPTKLMRSHGPVSSSLQWIGWNQAARSLLSREGPGRSLVVRYEDFVAHPRETLVAIAELVGERPAKLPLLDEGTTARLGTNHTVSGNPSRFQNGLVHLRNDDEWAIRQRPLDRALTSAVTLPWLRRYGYPARVGTGADPGTPPHMDRAVH